MIPIYFLILKKVNVVVHAISTINPGNSNEKYFFGYKMIFTEYKIVRMVKTI